MPVVHLDASLFDPATRYTLAEIEAWMLWPDDPEARQEACRTSAVEYARATIDFTRAGPALAAATVEIAAEAVPLRHLTGQAQAAFARGVAAGYVLAEAVAAAEIGEPFKLQLLAAHAAKSIKITLSTFNNSVWPKYKKVSHLYASSVVLGLSNEHHVFPCRLADLPLFLAHAEYFRRVGEALRPLNRADMMLASGDAITFAVPFKLPESSLTFSKRR